MSNSSHEDYRIYTYEQIRALANLSATDVVLIDVREPAEFAEVNIPTSINVPYNSYPHGLTMEAAVFEANFKVTKPSLDREIVIFCASGRRAAQARIVAINAGYKRVSLYPGSIKDWVAKNGGKL